ncbi:MAG: tetratricopeptide repeat protein [Chitinivibrionales bacterium]|nr:tetratricopeptide repeat protein [Chitinivibrionales bacterium]
MRPRPKISAPKILFRKFLTVLKFHDGIINKRMHLFQTTSISVLVSIILCCTTIAQAEKVLIYDEEKGIIFVEKEKSATKGTAKKEKPSPGVSGTQQPQQNPGIRKPSNKEDIHIGRKKDPPELYFRSGLEYFKNQDYENALKNFTFADSVDPKPLYTLWVGKSLRRLERYQQMHFVMEKLLNTAPESDVADDALFEIAFHNQKTNNYEKAVELYARLAEQYPFGRSFSNGQEFREIAREQRRMMRAEIISILRLLGYKGEDLTDLYISFQTRENLEVTGTGTQETINAIKARHQEHLQREEEKRLMEERTQKHKKWGIFIGIFVLINLAAIIIQRFVISSKVKHLESMANELIDLETHSL